MKKRKLRTPVLVVGIMLIAALSFFAVKTIVESISEPNTLEYTKTEVFTLKDHENVKFNIEYTNNKTFNKLVEKNIQTIFDKNSNIFTSKDKNIIAKFTVNSKYNLATYTFLDESGNMINLYGVLLFDLNNKELIDPKTIFFDDLKGLSMLVRNELAKDESLVYNKLTYVKTVPSAENFENIVFEEDQISFKFNREAFDVDDVKTASLSYEDVMSYFSDDFIKRLDKDYVRDDVSTVRYIDPLQPMVAVTFDDGPLRSTSIDIGDYFKDRGSRLSYFWLGERIANSKDIVKQLYDDGHEIANHSSTHRDFNKLSDEDLEYETHGINKMIQDITGQKSVLIRPPYGSANEHVRSFVKSPLIMWSVDPMDWSVRDTDEVYKNIQSTIHDGAIILLHDLYETSTAAAKRVIDNYSDSYQFVTVSEMYQYKGVPLVDGKLHFDGTGVR